MMKKLDATIHSYTTKFDSRRMWEGKARMSCPHPGPNSNFEPETSLESTSVEKVAALVDWMVCNADQE
jgi:hypothetical protein